jgi:hypothetical protein
MILHASWPRNALAVLLSIACIMTAAATPLGSPQPTAKAAASAPIRAGCIMLAFWDEGPTEIGLQCDGACVPDCESTGPGIIPGTTFVACPCYATSQCAAIFDLATGAFHCLQNGCSAACTKETDIPEPGTTILPCACI